MSVRFAASAGLVATTVLLAGCASVSPSWAVTGTVSGDAAADGCDVTFQSDHGDDVVVETDSASKFAAPDLPQGDYRISAECQEATSPVTELFVDADRYVQLQLDPSSE